jgi:hypothetical protein
MEERFKAEGSSRSRSYRIHLWKLGPTFIIKVRQISQQVDIVPKYIEAHNFLTDNPFW